MTDPSITYTCICGKSETVAQPAGTDADAFARALISFVPDGPCKMHQMTLSQTAARTGIRQTITFPYCDVQCLQAWLTAYPRPFDGKLAQRGEPED